jgi:aryl sulfotransferase
MRADGCSVWGLALDRRFVAPKEPLMADAQAPRTRYRSILADSARWDGFVFRPDDIIISTPPKCGTTWTQMLCALLIFDGPAFPAPLDEVSPWLDLCTRPLAEVTAALAAQTHRRFIKTHTPLDGLPLHADVTYLVVGRDPRDVAVSFEHHDANMNVAHFLALRAAAVGNADLAELPPRPVLSPDPVARFRTFVADETPGSPVTLASVLHHLDTAWQRRHEPNVALFHYADLTTDLVGELLRLACVLGIPCSPERARELAAEASLARMRERGAEVAPSASPETRGSWKDVRAFFRSGGTGEWRERLSAVDLAAHEARVAALVGPNLAAWVHGGRLASGVDPER